MLKNITCGALSRRLWWLPDVWRGSTRRHLTRGRPAGQVAGKRRVSCMPCVGAHEWVRYEVQGQRGRLAGPAALQTPKPPKPAALDALATAPGPLVIITAQPRRPWTPAPETAPRSHHHLSAS